MERIGGSLILANVAEIVCDTPKYMSPEQALTGDVDARSDVYAIGCVMFECLVGCSVIQHCVAYFSAVFKRETGVPSIGVSVSK